MATLAFLNVRDVVAVLIVARRNRSESTLVVISNAYAKLPNFYACQGFLRHPLFKHFLKRIQTAHHSKSDNLDTLII